MNDDFLTILRDEPRPEFAQGLWRRLSSLPPNRQGGWRMALAAAALVLVVGGSVIAALLLFDGGAGPRSALALSPTGNDVPRLTPIRVVFASPPDERDGAKLIAVDPPIAGEFAWENERTLLFLPAFPGFLRGTEYRVTVAPRPEAGLEKTHRSTFVTEGPLRVEVVVPAPDDVEVPAAAQILVQFSRSVAPLTTLGEQRTAPVIVFEPPLAGKGEWLNTSLYRFVPERFQADTAYRARIPAGLSTWADGVLERDFTWSFTTYGPAIDSFSVADNSEFAGLRQPVTVYFNQPMDRSGVERALKFVEAGTENRVAGTTEWNAEGTALTFTPPANLKNATNYTVSLPEGLKSARGSATRSGRSATFKTVPLPSVASTEPRDGATDANRYGFNVRFAGPMDPESLDGRVSVSGFSQEDVDRGLQVYDTTLYVGLPFKASTRYSVSITAGAKDRYGQTMGAYRFSFTTGKLPESLSFAVPSQVATYSASQEPLLYFHSSNRATAAFSLYPLTDAEIRWFQSPGVFPNPQPGNQPFKPSLPPLRQWTERLEVRQDEVSVNSTSLSGGGPLPRGDYYVSSEGGEKSFNSALAFSVVDTAIVTKQSADALLVWAFDLDTGAPLAGATVQARGGSIAGPAAKTADASGLVEFALAAPATAEQQFERAGWGVVTVSSGGRYGVSTPQWSRGVEPYRLGLPRDFGYDYGYSSGSGRRMIGHIYPDRAIYRPGEEVFFKAVVREDDDATYYVPPDGVPVDYTIISSQGRPIITDRVRLNEFGTFGGSFKLPADADTGSYGIQLTWEIAPGGQRLPIAGAGFLVAEFRKPEFEVLLETGKPAYATGDEIDATATAAFFFGGQVAGAKVEWTARSTPFAPRFKGYERYAFGDADTFYRYDTFTRSVTRDPVRGTGTGLTAADGKARFNVPALIRGDEGPQEFQLSATVTDVNGQAVAASTKVSVHPGSLYAGIRARDYIAAGGRETSLQLVTVDTEGKAAPQTPVTVNVYERKWVTTKVSTPGGGRTYRSEPVDTLLTALTATTDARGEASVPFTPERAGSIRLVAEVKDSKNRVAKSATYLWVSSGQFVSWYVGNDDSLQLIADRERYEVGDTAQVLVPAPFDNATGLVTVERGKVHSARVQAFPTNSTVVPVPITARSVPNVFVSTVLYRPPTEADPVARYKVGYVYLPVSTTTRVLNVSITPDRPQAKPGDRVRYEVAVTDSAGRPVRAELSVAVIDKAVVSLADERGPTGLRAFWFERGLGVSTASSLAVSVNRANDVITEPRQGKGGGGVEDERLREDFKNTAFWAPQLATGANGRASFEVTMPDNLTTWRTQVRAVSGDTLVGEGVNELLSTQPLLLRPALPRFARVGDKFDLRMLVRNATQFTTDVVVSIEAAGVELRDTGSRTVRIEPGESKLVSWPAAVTREGRAKLTFRARSGTGLGDAILQEFPAFLDVTPETTATGGVVTDKPRTEALFIPSYAITDRGTLDVAVQASLTGLLSDQLAQFAPPPAPYDATEGTVPIAVRVIATAGVLRAAKSAGTGVDPALQKQLDTDVARLVLRQNTDGGWRWCETCLPATSNSWATLSAIVGLAEATKAGKAVDDAVGLRAELYLLGYLGRTTDVLKNRDPNEAAQMLYALAALGRKTTTESLVRSLFEQERARLTIRGKAWLLLALLETGQDRKSRPVQGLLGDLAAAVIPSANGNHWENVRGEAESWRYRYDSDALVTTSAVLHALNRLDPAHPLIEETVRWVMVARGARTWNAAPLSAQAVNALSEYAAGTGELAGDFTYSVQAGERELLQGSLKGTQPAPASVKVPLSELGKGLTPLTFERDYARKGRMYYSLNYRYVTPAVQVEALNRGIAVSHEYTALADPKTPITRAKVGDVVRVRVTVVAPAERNLVTVEDFLPGGLEPIDASLKTTDPALIQRLQQDQARASQERRGKDDSIYPWYSWYWSPFGQAVMRDDRVVLRANVVPRGVHEYVYFVRATTPGDFYVSPAHAEEGQFPEVFGRSDSSRFVVEQ